MAISRSPTLGGEPIPNLNDQDKSLKKTGGLLGEDSDLEIPDGGWTAWSTAFGAFLIQICGFGFTNSFGVFQDFYSQHYLTNVSSSAIAWIGSVNAFLVLSGGLFFGRLFDRGYFYHLVICGCTLQVFCLFMLSLTKENQYYQVFLCHGLGFGLAASMSYVPSIAVLSHHFKAKRAIVMTVVVGGSPLGGTLYPILLNNLLDGELGFANSIRVSGAMNGALLLLACLLMRTRMPPQKTDVRYREVLRRSSCDPAYIFASIGMFLFAAGSFFPMFYIQLDSAMHGLGEKFSFYTLVMLNAANFVGRSTAGFIAAYTGIPTSVIGATSCSTAVIFAMMGLDTQASAVTISILFGYFAGAYVALSAPLVALLTSDFSELGTRIGISFMLAGLGGLIGAPISGVLLTESYNWWRPAVFCGCFAGASSILFAISQLILLRTRERRELSAPATSDLA
ncbi:hypothetical protein HYDPIDRAFT_25313 [Hydnomerulius pinastri MD-312]|nr:hypothetical protein HYDPIDRAFT_25313 [Hydnomerulius pinastri MD-312]